jgi:hypothetical protein
LSLLLLLIVLTLTSQSGCNPTYYCGRQCYEYNNGVEICQTTNADAQRFAASVDSLNNLYGTGTSFFADSVTVNGSSENAENSVVHQLQGQGYTCNSSDL